MNLEEANAALDELAGELPQEFYRDLNGGILLSPEVKHHPEEPGLYVMGEYHTHPALGRYIIIYYGSFQRVYGGLPPAHWKRELRRTLRHEFTHHVESLAGAKDLERKDAENIERYRAMRNEE